MLTTIDHGTGLRTEVGYAHSSRHYLDAEAEGDPWFTRLPHHTFVVEEIRDVDDIAGVTRTQAFRYADGAKFQPSAEEVKKLRAAD